MPEQPERLKSDHHHFLAHMSHCNEGENVGTCKYGEDAICPAFSTDPSTYPNEWSPLQVKRAIAKARFLPLVCDLPDNIRAAVFRHTPGWLNEERHFEAGFASEKYARDFVSMMESPEYTWTVVTVHPYSDGVRLGTVTEFNGGLQVTSTINV